MNAKAFSLRTAWVILLGISVPAFGVTIVDLGVASPPSSLGGIAVAPLPPDLSAPNSLLSSLATPGGGVLTFDYQLEHLIVPSSWASWSHGYTGDVYLRYAANTLSISSSGVDAFYFYVQPDWTLSELSFTVSSGTESLTLDINGVGGAHGFGFFLSPGETTAVVDIVDNTGADFGFAVGEFGAPPSSPSNVPDTSGTALLLVPAILLLRACRRRF